MCRRDMWAGTLALTGLSYAGRGKLFALGGGVDNALLDVGDGLLAGAHRVVHASLGDAALTPNVSAQRTGLPLDAATVALEHALDRAAALTQLALHARPRPLELTLGAVACGGAAPLEAAQVALDPALGRLAAAIRLDRLGDRLDHAITRDEGGTDGNEDRAPGQVLSAPRGGPLAQLAGGRGALGGRAAAPSVGTARGGGALAAGGAGGGRSHTVSLSFEMADWLVLVPLDVQP